MPSTGNRATRSPHLELGLVLGTLEIEMVVLLVEQMYLFLVVHKWSYWQVGGQDELLASSAAVVCGLGRFVG